MFSLIKTKTYIGILTLLLGVFSVHAQDSETPSGYEITPYFGYMFGPEIGDGNGGDIDISDDAHLGLAFSWRDSPNGQGQILINYVSHDFDNPSDGGKEDLNVLYTHFNGVAEFRDGNYVTTFSIGLGGAYIDTDYESEIFPSATLAVGTRYEFTPFFAMFTEIRGYATYTDEDDETFCRDDVCIAEFDDAIYYDTSISVGLAFAF
ncbi:outer membrane beta-barrel protein [Thalassotalea euphylliae]|uniref:outer membrane beta-barrel protein n=1 Tax=Thalassotalea euphylliae TaxID=1655234 RepID=UPI0036315452